MYLWGGRSTSYSSAILKVLFLNCVLRGNKGYEIELIFVILFALLLKKYGTKLSYVSITAADSLLFWALVVEFHTNSYCWMDFCQMLVLVSYASSVLWPLNPHL